MLPHIMDPLLNRDLGACFGFPVWVAVNTAMITCCGAWVERTAHAPFLDPEITDHEL